MNHTTSKLPKKLFLLLPLLAGACAVTTHEEAAKRPGQPTHLSTIERRLAEPGPIALTTVKAADWQVDRAGLINLDQAKAHGLEDGKEDIHIYFHAIEHPQRGLFLIDTGVAAAIKSDGKAPSAGQASPLGWPVRQAMDFDALKVHENTATWLAKQGEPVRGVFLTHLHLDHIMGLPDVAADVPIYTGPGEAGDKSFMNLFVQGTANQLLEGRSALRTWAFPSAATKGALAAVDVFGDESLFAVHVPGHTPGSTAFVVRTTRGPVLLVGDACHTSWGWEHQVEPGTFSRDQPQSAKSLALLRAFADRNPGIDVRLGHQEAR